MIELEITSGRLDVLIVRKFISLMKPEFFEYQRFNLFEVFHL